MVGTWAWLVLLCTGILAASVGLLVGCVLMVDWAAREIGRRARSAK